jgi:hypothetical protein
MMTTQPGKTFREAATYLSSSERRATQLQIADGVGAVRPPAGSPLAATRPDVTHWRIRKSLARRRQYQQAKGTNEEGKYHG